MHKKSVNSAKFARNVAAYLEHVRYTGESVAITKGMRIVAELVPAKPLGFPVSELAALIAGAPKLGDAS